MAGTLYVVATPIGNLEDITLRALRVLREVSIIAAEDTRRTARLLQHYSISTPTTSLHEHNERRRAGWLVEQLRGGKSVALVSDAGTPAVSDPGTGLVAAAHAAGIRVEPVPGPNAAVALISASGLAPSGFVFIGFPPHRSKARKELFASVAKEPRALVLYEAPHRVEATMRDLLAILGDRPVAVGRELTKMHEDLVVYTISAALASLGSARGEYTIVVSGAASPERAVVPAWDRASLAAEFGEMTESSGMTPRAAARQLATKYDLSPRVVYGLVHREPKSVV